MRCFDRVSHIGNSGAPDQNGGVMARRLFDIVGLMKGHVGGGSGLQQPLGAV